MERLVVSPREAAKALDVGNTRIYELIDTGVIPAYRMGNGWKIPVAGLKEFVIEKANTEAEERRNKCQK